MKTILVLSSLLISFAASAANLPLVLEGKDSEGKLCTLTIESWEFKPDMPQEWYALKVTVRSSWQLAANPSLQLEKSPTPWALYGKSSGNYDQMAIFLFPDKLNPEDAVQSYQFQTWDPERKLVQTMCRFR